MLTCLQIKDYTILESLELDIHDSMTVITGETGAGKSIMFGALSLCLGNRADSKVVRHGTEKCDLSACFDITNNRKAQTWLKDHELWVEGDCILRRVINQDGRSRSFINGQATPLQLTRELSTFLVNIHGQHEQQSLLKREYHREQLDNVAGHNHLLDAVKTAYDAWRATQEALDNLLKSSDNPALRELLTYQVKELDDLGLTEKELLSLEKEHKQLANADELIANCQQANQLLSDDNDINCMDLIDQIQQLLLPLQEQHEHIKNANEMLQNAQIHLQESKTEVQSLLDNFNYDPERLKTIEQRLQKIYDCSRKHKIKAMELPGLHQKLRLQLDSMDNSEAHLEKLKKDLVSHEQNYFDQAAKLSQSRRTAANKLAKQITKHIQGLGMPGGQLTITFNTPKESIPKAYGNETIEFMVSTNPGQPLRPLNKVASGGELSRISLAIQVITATQEGTPCLLFDEVDVGIGGKTAHIVGELLQKLGKNAQVICVTHLPQVAAQAKHHFIVEKTPGKNKTQTQVNELKDAARISEIARMMGGANITDQSLAHAKELLQVSV